VKLRKKGDISEKKAAKKVGAKIIKGSGCLWYEKGDYETDKIVYQNKFSGTGKYQLKIEELLKAEKDAFTKNKDFIFSIELSGEFFYVFRRYLINEDEENLLDLYCIVCNKSLNLNEKILSKNLLINDEFIVLNEYDFKNIGLR
jgi:hypothetical protein